MAKASAVNRNKKRIKLNKNFHGKEKRTKKITL